LEVRSGEILGIAGLVGAGRTTLLRALAGAEPRATGTLMIDGRSRGLPPSPREALDLGIVLAPENRKSQGLILGRSVADNVALPHDAAGFPLRLLRSRTVRAGAEGALARLRFPSGRLDADAGKLSGGNQQKVVLAKCFSIRPRVLLVDEPVRGIDVGAKAEIFDLLTDLAGEGTAVVMVSEEIEELCAACHRILVLAGGTLTAELTGEECEPQAVLSAMFARPEMPV
jgi:ABC-type sugar transport system ATPase subunit